MTRKQTNPANPVTVARETLGLTKAEFARRRGLPYDALVRVELGYLRALPPRILRALEEVGVAPDAAQTAIAPGWRRCTSTREQPRDRPR